MQLKSDSLYECGYFYLVILQSVFPEQNTFFSLLAGKLILAIIVQKSFRSKKIWVVELCFVSLLSTIVHSYQILKMVLCKSTKLRL